MYKYQLPLLLLAGLSASISSASITTIVANTPYDEDTEIQRILVLRGQVPSYSEGHVSVYGFQNILREAAGYYYDISDERLGLTFDMEDNVYTISSASKYEDPDGEAPFQPDVQAMLEDTIARAESSGHDVDSYDAVMFLQFGVPWEEGGIGEPGTMIIRGYRDFYIVGRQLGRHLGLGNASTWVPETDNPFGPGEYRPSADPYDLMGTGRGYLNPAFRSQLGWLDEDQVINVEEDGEFVIWEHAVSNPAGPITLRLEYAFFADLWISLDPQTSGPNPTGVEARWLLRAPEEMIGMEGEAIGDVLLLDGNPSLLRTNLVEDQDYIMALPGVTINVLETGETAGDAFARIEVTFGDRPITNINPLVNVLTAPPETMVPGQPYPVKLTAFDNNLVEPYAAWQADPRFPPRYGNEIDLYAPFSGTIDLKLKVTDGIGGLTEMTYTVDVPEAEFSPWSTVEADNLPAPVELAASGNNRFIVLDRAGLQISTSFDGIEWATLLNVPAFTEAYDLEFAAGSFYLFTDTGTYSTADGITWVSEPVPNTGGGRPIQLNYNGTRFTMISADGKIWISSTGHNWSLVLQTGETLRNVASNGTITVVQGDEVIFTSIDGLEWEETEAPMTGDSVHVLFRDGQFVAWEETYGKAWGSVDGETWELLNRGEPVRLPGTTGSFGDSDEYMLATVDGYSGLWLSVTGVDWYYAEIGATEGNTLGSENLFAVRGESRILVFDAEGNIGVSTALQSYTISTTTPEPTGGTFTGLGTYPAFTTVELLAEAEEGYFFSGWSGDIVSLDNPLDIFVTEDVSIAAQFTTLETDSDNDGLTDFEELTVYGTSPTEPDSDFDDIDDFAEVNAGLDPLNDDSLVYSIIGDNPDILGLFGSEDVDAAIEAAEEAAQEAVIADPESFGLFDADALAAAEAAAEEVGRNSVLDDPESYALFTSQEATYLQLGDSEIKYNAAVAELVWSIFASEDLFNWTEMGQLSVEVDIEEGSTFYLPRAEEPADAPAPVQ